MIRSYVLILVAALSLAQTSPKDRPRFEVASIKPAKSGRPGMGIRIAPGDRFMATNVAARMLIVLAYKIQPFQLSGGPSWLGSDPYDIEATPERTGDDEPGKQPHEDFQKQMDVQRLRLQSLLEDRFQLKFHRETKELPTYALVVAKGGPKLQPSEQKGDRRPMMRMGRGHFESNGITLAQLADNLSMQTGRKVLDRTELTGNYDIKFDYAPDQSQGGGPGFGGPPGGGPGPGPGPEGGMGPPPPDPNGPTIFTALQEQLGLKLESQKGPVEILVIDHVEKPSEN